MLFSIPVVLYLITAGFLDTPREEPQLSIVFNDDPTSMVAPPWTTVSEFGERAIVTGRLVLPELSKPIPPPRAIYFSGYEGRLQLYHGPQQLIDTDVQSVVQGPTHLQDLLVPLPRHLTDLDLRFRLTSSGTQFLRFQPIYIGTETDFESANARHQFYYTELRNVFLGIEAFLVFVLGALIATKQCPYHYRYLVGITLFLILVQASSIQADPFSLNDLYHHFLLLLPFAICLGFLLAGEINGEKARVIKNISKFSLGLSAVFVILIESGLIRGAEATIFYSLPGSLITWVIGTALLLARGVHRSQTYLSVALFVTSVSIFTAIVHDIAVKFALLDSNLLFVPLCIPIFLASVGLAITLDFSNTWKNLEALNRDLWQHVGDAKKQIQSESAKRVMVEVEKAKNQTHKRFMMDLHDGPLGYLSSIHTLLEDQTTSQAVAARSLTKKAIDEVRVLLHRETFEHQGSLFVVFMVFKDQLESRLQTLGVELLMDVTSLQGYVSPNDQFNLDVYRILQEATTNAIERADCKVLRFASYSDLGFHIVTIENAGGRPLAMADDGQAVGGLGINNMASRTRRHSGGFTITSTPTGARVTLRLP